MKLSSAPSRLERDRTQELRRRLHAAIIFPLPALLLLESVTYRVNRTDVLSWSLFAAILMMNGARFYHIRFSKQQGRAWQRHAALMAGAMGTFWGAFFFRNVALAQSRPGLQLLIFLYGFGLMVASSNSMAVSKKMYAAYTLPLLMAMASAVFLISDDLPSKFVGLGIFAMYGCFSSLQRTLLEQSWLKNQLQSYEIQEKKAELENSAKLAALGEMSAGIAHEINNPIFVISSQAQLMMMKIESDPEREQELMPHLNMILNTCDRIVRIVRGLKALSWNEGTDEFERISIRSLLEQTAELCRPQLVKSGAKIEIDSADEDLLAEVKPVQISQVLLNLLNNAQDAVREAEDPWIRVEAKTHGDLISISVTDSGPGVEPGVRNRIMEPFFTTKKKGKGTGLGLSISSGILKSHGGKLYLDPEHPNTRFVAEFPRRR